MRLFFHFVVQGFSNTYLLGQENSSEGILIDPGIMDTGLLTLIENNGLYIKHILVTHSHHSHVDGIRTLKKIYDSDIIASTKNIMGFDTKVVSGDDVLELAGFTIKVLEIPGHSSDSLVFHTENMVFTGDVMSAGVLGSTPNPYAKALLVDSIKEKLFPMDDHTLIFPGHGPPSSIRAEKLYNPFLTKKEEQPL